MQLLTICYTHQPSLRGTGDGSVPIDRANRSTKLPLNEYLVKFAKPVIPLPELFSIEGQFYQLADELIGSDDRSEASSSSSDHDEASITNTFPFRLVKALATGPCWLLLQYISDDIMTYDVHSGCPPELFDDLLIRLARMHASCWVLDGDGETASTQPFVSLLRHRKYEQSMNPGAGHTHSLSLSLSLFIGTSGAVPTGLACSMREVVTVLSVARRGREHVATNG
jgi:hypothetical protein